MLQNYIPVALFLLIGLGLGTALIVIGALLSRYRPDPEKCSPYECGFDAFESSRIPVSVRYYLVAILFIIFDLETAFLFPWAVMFRELPDFALWTMGIFLTLLTIGFIYEWKKGALEWE